MDGRAAAAGRVFSDPLVQGSSGGSYVAASSELAGHFVDAVLGETLARPT